MRACVESYDIMVIINKAREESFARTEKNRNAISERGWYPYNRNLLNYKEVRATMTKDEKLNEIEYDVIIKNPSLVSDLSDDTPTMEDKYNPFTTTNASSLCFSDGKAASVLDKIVQHSDIMSSRERIKKEHETGKSFVEKMRSSKKISAGNIFKCGRSRIGKDVFSLYLERMEATKEAKKQAIEKEKEQWKKYKQIADEIMDKKKSPSEWTTTDLMNILRPLKAKGEKIPTSKKERYETYLQQKERPPPRFESDTEMSSTYVSIEESEDQEGDVNNEYEDLVTI